MQLMIPPANRPESIYQMPALGWFSSHVGAVSLGIGRGALDQLVELSLKKVPSMSMAVLADRAVAQVDIARAEAALVAARAFLHESVEELWKAVRAGKQATARQIALNRMAAAHAAETGALVSRTANVLAGGSSIFAPSPLQRFARDAEAILHHFTVAPHIWEDAGRALLGRPTIAPMF
jgi:alkylation response protein AidB-like acyl-CoA dehydrogenase